MDAGTLGQAALAAAVGVPLLAATGTGGSQAAARWRAGWSWVAAAAAVVALVAVAVGGPVGLVARAGSLPAWGLVADGLTVSLLTLVCLVGALVQSFSGRYLSGDARSGRFGVAAAWVVAAMAVVSVSATVAGMVAAWVVAGLGFTRVAGARRDLPGVAGLVRVMRTALLTGDAALVAAAVIVLARAGNVGTEYTALQGAAARLGGWAPLVAGLIAVAAMSRCAQGVFQGWLRLTVSAPTPACALLHAGVVNGGGILLVRLAPLAAWTPALAAVSLAGTATATWAVAVMARQPDVKGRLASSTSAQMGFMLVECCVGAHPAAVVHLIGHGLYKAGLFLSSGSTVRRPGSPGVPEPVGGRARAGAAAVAAAAATAAAAPGVATGDGLVLVVLVAATAWTLANAWWARRPAGEPRRWLWPVLLVVAAGAYGAVAAVVGGFVARAVPGAGTGLPVWVLLGVPAAAAVFTWAATRTRAAVFLGARLLDAAVAPVGWDRPRPPSAAAVARPHRPEKEPVLESAA
ncbi:proton-conducting transporter membrane subunit [Streptomyces sp. NPDC001380]|uniref:proton-conducting transporter transmembrane domain-containing protein n=1 Tax=Streptomyces sp. NPDC001380 TaxID=3364566 RepID=UPI0036777401